MGRGTCVPSLLFALRSDCGGDTEDNGDSLQRPQAGTAALRTLQPCCRPPPTTPLPETAAHSRASLGQSLVGSLLLSPGSWCTQGCVRALQESVSPVLCKFWWLSGGVTSSKRAYAIPKSAAPRALPLQQFTNDLFLHGRHSNTVCLSLCGVSGSWSTQGECTGHSKHPLPTAQEKTLHMDITTSSIQKSD